MCPFTLGLRFYWTVDRKLLCDWNPRACRFVEVYDALNFFSPKVEHSILNFLKKEASITTGYI